MDIYACLLDLFPLTDEIQEYNPMVADLLQRKALDVLLFRDKMARDQVLILLKLSADLGYVDMEIVEYLRKQLSSIRANAFKR